MIAKIRQWLLKWAWVFISAIGIFTIIYCSIPHGVGVSHDSIHYFSAAKNLIEGNGAFTNFYGKLKPLVHYPAFYPFVLALLSFGNFEMETVASFLNAFLLAINGCLVFYLVVKGTGNQIIAGLIGFSAFFCSYMTLSPHLMAWTEPLFIALMLSGFWMLNFCFDQSSDEQYYKSLAWAGCFVALAILTRYAGFALLPVAFLTILFHSSKKWPGKLVDFGFFVLPSMIIVGGWLLRNQLLKGNPTNRTIELSVFPYDLWVQFQNNLVTWYYGNNDGALWTWSALGITFGLLFLALGHYLKQKRKPRIQGFLALFSFAYLIFLVMVPIMGVSIPFNARMLFPFFTGFVISAVIFAFNIVPRLPYKTIFYIAIVIIGMKWSYDSFDFSAYFLKVNRERGRGFANKKLQEREELKFIANQPDSTFIFSKNPDYKYYNYLIDKTVYPFYQMKYQLNQPDQQKAYVVFYHDCCEDGQKPRLPTGFTTKKPIVNKKIYQITRSKD